MLTVTSTAIDAVKVVTPKLIADLRGAFCETYNQERFAGYGILANFVQDNQSASAAIGTRSRPIASSACRLRSRPTTPASSAST